MELSERYSLQAEAIAELLGENPDGESIPRESALKLHEFYITESEKARKGKQ